MTPEVCPNCGAEVPRNAKACPNAVPMKKPGWSEPAYASSLGLPDEKFDYDEFVKEEFGAGRAKRAAPGWFWWVIALLAAIFGVICIFVGDDRFVIILILLNSRRGTGTKRISIFAVKDINARARPQSIGHLIQSISENNKYHAYVINN